MNDHEAIDRLKDLLFDPRALPCGWERESIIKRNNAIMRGIEAIKQQEPVNTMNDAIQGAVKSLLMLIHENKDALANGGNKPRMYYQGIDDALSPFEGLFEGIRAQEREEC